MTDDLIFDPDEDEEDLSQLFAKYTPINTPTIQNSNKKNTELKFSNKRAEFSIPIQFIQNSSNNTKSDDRFTPPGDVQPLSFTYNNSEQNESVNNQSQNQNQSQNTSTNNTIQAIINNARQYIGGKYISGGHKPENGGFDCSGLLYYVFNQHGIKLPRATYDIFKFGTEIQSLKDVQPGDIICTPGRGYTRKHVKMVSKIENGQIYTIEAKGRKYGIVENPLTKTDNIVTIRRPIQQNKYGGILKTLYMFKQIHR